MYLSTNRHGRSSTRSRGRNGHAASRHHKKSDTKARFGNRSRFSHTRTPRHSRSSRKLETFDVSRYINRNPVSSDTAITYAAKHTFADFGLSEQIQTIIATSGLKTPTQIQDEVIPHILKGHDVVGLANTGTGKTAAFLIPLIELAVRADHRQTLVLTPTRELAIQVEQEFRNLSKNTRLYSVVCVGGTSIRSQIMGLRKRNHFVIGTPGRILDLIKRGSLKPEGLSTVVLDEADRMLDMGFIHDIRKILKGVPTNRETLFFSATMSKDIELLIRDFSHSPITVSVKKQDITNNIEQDVVSCHGKDKFSVLTDLLKQKDLTRVLIFGAMKHSVERLSKQLTAHGIPADSIHGNKSHSQRQRSLKRFKENQVHVLVATDVAARGIHVDNISHVINYDLPATYEDYVHRIGRTGRGNERGKAFTFVS